MGLCEWVRLGFEDEFSQYRVDKWLKSKEKFIKNQVFGIHLEICVPVSATADANEDNAYLILNDLTEFASLICSSEYVCRIVFLFVILLNKLPKMRWFFLAIIKLSIK